MRRVALLMLCVISGAAILATGAHGAPRALRPHGAYSICRSSAMLVCLTRSAGNHVTTVQKGETVELTLTGSTLQWSEPEIVGAKILLPIGAALSRGGASRERFKAVRVGHTAIQATATAKCSPGEMCPQFALVWRAAVVVTN